MNSQERQAAEARGRRAESLAAKHLESQGFELLDQRVITGVGELDLVMLRGPLVIFVEVKMRESLEAALWSIDPRQQQRIMAAANAWVGMNPQFAAHDMRLDAVLVDASYQITHIENAIEPI